MDVAGDDDGGDDMDMENDTVWIPHHFTRLMELLDENVLQEDEHIDTVKGYSASVFFAVNLMNGPSTTHQEPPQECAGPQRHAVRLQPPAQPPLTPCTPS